MDDQLIIEQFIVEVTGFHGILLENKEKDIYRKRENTKWQLTLLVAMCVPVFANNFIYFKNKIKHNMTLILLCLIFVSGIFIIYGTSVRPFLLDLNLEARVKFLIPSLYEYKKYLKKNNVQKSSK